MKLVGGRLLPGPTGPASFLMYESASGERFTIYTAKADAEATQMRYAAQGKEGALFWADRGVAYRGVSGGSDRERLTQIAQAGLRPDGEDRRVRQPSGRLSQFRHRKSGIRTIGASH